MAVPAAEPSAGTGPRSALPERRPLRMLAALRAAVLAPAATFL